ELHRTAREIYFRLRISHGIYKITRFIYKRTRLCRSTLRRQSLWRPKDHSWRHHHPPARDQVLPWKERLDGFRRHHFLQDQRRREVRVESQRPQTSFRLPCLTKGGNGR